MEKKKLLKRLSALGFAMYECRLYCDTHPNDTEALQMLNDYKSKYKAVKAEFEQSRKRLVEYANSKNTMYKVRKNGQ